MAPAAYISTTQWQLTNEAKADIVRSLTNALQTSYTTYSALLCASLIDEGSDKRCSAILVQLLLSRIRADHSEDALEVAKSTAWLSNALLDAIVDELYACSSDTRERLGSTDRTDPTSIVPLLRCASRLVSNASSSAIVEKVMSLCLRLIRSKDKHEAFAARAVIFALMSQDDCAIMFAQEIRECVSSHLLSEHALPFQHTLGYSLWLRQLSSTPSLLLPNMHEQQYWDMIARGLQFGDNERRKLCIEILRLSVHEIADHGQINLLTNKENVSPTALISQYTRYCTVFETLALARYQNLLLETEKDLNQLASSTALVDSRWLYVLLHMALGPDMQDQNRKIVGTWYRSHFQGQHTNSSKDLFHFLERTFLPWATEGHLFVSTIKINEMREWHCSHGTQLSDFIVSLLDSNNADDVSTLLTMLLSFLRHNRSKMFLFSAVYIMDGLLRSVDRLTPTTAQCKVLLELSAWQGFPETAKEFIRKCCWTMVSASNVDLSNLSESSSLQYSTLKAHFEDTNYLLGAHLSEREQRIRAAVQKCSKLQHEDYASTSAELCEALDDIWTDAEYFVYTRELLTMIPQTILSAHAVRLAAHDEELSSLIRRVTQRLLKLADTRSYVLAPLMAAIRTAVITTPEVLQVLALEEHIIGIADAPPQPKIDLQFEYTVHLLMQARFGQNADDSVASSESRGFAIYLDLVSRLYLHQELVRSIANAIISRWKRQKIPTPTISAFKTTLQLQVLILCCEQLVQLSTVEADVYLQDLFFLLSIEPLPRYRYLLSWAILRLLTRKPHEHNRLLQLLDTKDHHGNPKFLAALTKLAIDLASTNSVSEEFAARLASSFVALAASAKVVIRHEAQWSFPLLMDMSRRMGWSKISDNPAYMSLENYIRSLPHYDEPPPDRVYSQFDLAQHNTLSNLIEGLWTELDYNGLPLTHREDLMWLYQQDQRDGLELTPSCMPLGDKIDNASRSKRFEVSLSPSTTLITKQASVDESVALQTKGTAYLNNLLAGKETAPPRKHQLIVLASLVTNPYNLGGLSRVSEIFGAQALYVQDPKVVTAKDFISVAVSSHNHIDILPLAEHGIPAFLAERRAEGWTAVGVEQTDRSDLLGMPSTQLPDKTVLVIGNEREGMPGTVMAACDLLIEIPQRGITRSMNVQTVAAVVLYEYNRQHV